MSNQQHDLYLEDIARAEEDARDALLALGQATQDRQEATKWEDKMLKNFNEAEKRLQTLKNKEA